jgi:hypothetical protein
MERRTLDLKHKGQDTKPGEGMEEADRMRRQGHVAGMQRIKWGYEATVGDPKIERRNRGRPRLSEAQEFIPCSPHVMGHSRMWQENMELSNQWTEFLKHTPDTSESEWNIISVL